PSGVGCAAALACAGGFSLHQGKPPLKTFHKFPQKFHLSFIIYQKSSLLAKLSIIPEKLCSQPVGYRKLSISCVNFRSFSMVFSECYLSHTFSRCKAGKKLHSQRSRQEPTRKYCNRAPTPHDGLPPAYPRTCPPTWSPP